MEAGLVQEWIRTNRLLVLVENSTESALLIFIVSKNVADEFILERTVPLDTEFKCEIGMWIYLKKIPVILINQSVTLDTASANVVTTDVFLKLTRKKVHLLFEMLPGFKANKFVDEITKAIEGKFYSFFKI